MYYVHTCSLPTCAGSLFTATPLSVVDLFECLDLEYFTMECLTFSEYSERLGLKPGLTLFQLALFRANLLSFSRFLSLVSLSRSAPFCSFCVSTSKPLSGFWFLVPLGRQRPPPFIRGRAPRAVPAAPKVRSHRRFRNRGAE